MNTPELLILLYSLEALHETNNSNKALEIIKRSIDQLEKEKKKEKQQQEQQQ